MAILVDDLTTLVDDPDILVNGGTAATRPIPTYELGLWQRTPQSGSAATYVEVGPIVSPTITWSHLLDADGRLDAACLPDKLDTDVRTALRDAFTVDSAPQGCELRLLRTVAGTTETVWAGPLVGGQIQGGTLTLIAHGLAYYLRYMWITSDLTYTATDQWTIGKGLVDHWQNLAYGNYGIDTSGIGTSGTTRDRTYLAAEHPNVHRELGRLAAVDGGFNWWVDPDTRDLELATSRGSDLSASVVLDTRNIGDASIAFDVAAGEFGSEAFGVGTSGTEAPVTSTQSDTAVRQAFGRAGMASAFDGVTVQATLDDHTTRYLDDRDRPTFVPGVGSGRPLIPIEGADVGDFGPGDTVSWEFDAGLGLQTFTRRLLEVRTTVGPDGGERMSVAFL